MATSPTAIQKEDRTEEERKTDAFAQMDALDEEQIIAEMKGKVIEEYFYEITDKEGGRPQPGLSFSGTKWAKRKMGEQGHPISVVHAEVVDLEASIRVMTIVEDLADHTKLIGAYEQPRMMRVAERDGSGKKIPGKFRDVPNPNAFTLAVSKAERNGIRHHLPETVILEMYKEWKTLKAQKDKPSPAKEAPAAPAAAPAQGALEEISYELRDFEVQVTQQGSAIRVDVPKDMDNEEYTQVYDIAVGKHKGALVPANEEHGRYFEIKVA